MFVALNDERCRTFTNDGSRNVILITDGVPSEECATDLPPCSLFPPDFACLLTREPLIQNQVRVVVAPLSMHATVRPRSPPGWAIGSDVAHGTQHEPGAVRGAA